MNRQEIFDKVKSHLLTQNEQANSGEGGYCYENYKGLKCAIGCLLPKEHPGLEYDHGIIKLLEVYPDLGEFFDISDNLDVIFMHDLQIVHDSYEPELWPELLNKVARAWGLNG